MTAEVKVAVKIGNIELEFEGSTRTFDEKIQPIMQGLIEFGKDNREPDANDHEDETKIQRKTGSSPISMTVKSIAAKLGATTGGDLLYAAVASLSTLKKKETFTRKEINEEMRQATGYYKATYTNNLSGYLDGLIKQGVIIEISKDNYAVSEQSRGEMERRLA